MAAINNPEIIAMLRGIMREPGFSFAGQGLEFAFWRWVRDATHEQRLVLEKANFIRLLEDLRAEDRLDARPPLLPVINRASTPRVVQGTVAEDAPAIPERVAALKFRSVSPGWQEPEPEVPPERIWPAGSPRPLAPVTITSLVRHPEPVAQDNAPVQQSSRKIASYQHMFPELAFPVQTASGAKPLAQFGEQDIDYRLAAIREQRQAWRTANAGDEARVEERERLNARDRVRVAERSRNIRDSQAEEERLATARRELAGTGCAVIGELPPEILAACGFKRRVA